MQENQENLELVEPPKPALWRFYLLSIAVIVAGLLLVLAAQFALMGFGLLPKVLGEYGSAHMFTLVASQAVVFIGLYYFCINYLGFRRFPIFFEDAPLFTIIGQFILAVFVLLILYAAIFALLKALGIDEIKQFETLDRARLKEDPWPFYIAVAVIAPIYEELLFRGLFLPTLMGPQASRLKTAGAVLFTSLLFTSMHIESGLVALIPISFLALYLSGVALYKRSILFCILIHALQNFNAAYIMLHQDELLKMLEQAK